MFADLNRVVIIGSRGVDKRYKDEGCKIDVKKNLRESCSRRSTILGMLPTANKRFQDFSYCIGSREIGLRSVWIDRGRGIFGTAITSADFQGTNPSRMEALNIAASG